MKNIEISVIIPCFNQQKHIRECLDSIINQNYGDFEIIAVDDGSSDDTPKILREYAEKNNRMKILSGKNMGAGAARNFGLKEASGNYILFMDSDDFLEDGAFKILAAAIREKAADIYFFNFNTYDDKTGKYDEKIMFRNLGKRISFEGGSFGYSAVSFEERKEFFLWSYVAPWNKIYRREFISENNLKFDEFFSTNDRTFYFSSLIKSKNIVMLDRTLINYRINNAGSLTGSYNAYKFQNRKRAYESSVRWIDKSDRLLADTFFKVTVLDFVSFYHRTNNDERYSIFIDTMKFFRQMDTVNAPSARNLSERVGFFYNLFCESDYLLGIDKKKILPIVMASNDKYLPYLSTTLESIISHASSEYFYDVYILHTGLGELNKIKVCNMGRGNVHVRELDVSSLVKSLPLYSKGHFSVEMYYRILIPELLWQYEKVLYLDSDTVLCADAHEFFSLDIGDAVIGAVRNPLDADMHRYVTRELRLDAEEYFNSGMLIINTLAFARENIKDKCFEILSNSRRLACPDQDVLNLSCRDRCAYFGEVWNFQSGNALYTARYKYSVADRIKLIHYTTGNKPWNSEGIALSEFFWKHARNTPFYEDIILVYTGAFMKKHLTVLNCASEKKRTLINGMNMRHYKLINPDSKERKSILSWPFRMVAKFFSYRRKYGLWAAVGKIPDKLRYVKRRILGRKNDDS